MTVNELAKILAELPDVYQSKQVIIGLRIYDTFNSDYIETGNVSAVVPDGEYIHLFDVDDRDRD